MIEHVRAILKSTADPDGGFASIERLMDANARTGPFGRPELGSRRVQKMRDTPSAAMREALRLKMPSGKPTNPDSTQEEREALAWELCRLREGDRGGYDGYDGYDEDHDDYLPGPNESAAREYRRLRDDFGGVDGWYINPRAGTTGTPEGAPRSGLHERNAVLEHLVYVLERPEFEFRMREGLGLSGAKFRRHRRDTTYLLFAHAAEAVNTEALALIFNLSKRTAYNWIARGKKLAHKSLQSEECELTAEEMYSAVRNAVRDGIMDAQSDQIILQEGHPAEAAEKILKDDEDEGSVN